MTDNDLREALASLAHEQWSNWMDWMFEQGTFNPDGTWTMPAWAVNRWVRQCATPYEALYEAEKESDRAEADKMLAIFARAGASVDPGPAHKPTEAL